MSVRSNAAMALTRLAKVTGDSAASASGGEPAGCEPAAVAPAAACGNDSAKAARYMESAASCSQTCDCLPASPNSTGCSFNKGSSICVSRDCNSGFVHPKLMLYAAFVSDMALCGSVTPVELTACARPSE